MVKWKGVETDIILGKEEQVMNNIYNQAIETLMEISNIIGGNAGRRELMVIGCSTSTILGGKPGTNSDENVADELYRAVIDVFGDKWDIAVQCCEHLNRALVLERSVAEKYGFTMVNVVPHKKAGGSFATKHYYSLQEPAVVEDIASKATAGIDIGGVMIGMHMRPVVVPLKVEHNKIGEAIIIAGKSRLKYIGGERARYAEENI